MCTIIVQADHTCMVIIWTDDSSLVLLQADHPRVGRRLVAGVPGMLGGMFRHFRSLRQLKRDHGIIFTLLEEAENERMHLIVCMHFFEAGPATRAAVQIAQRSPLRLSCAASTSCGRSCCTASSATSRRRRCTPTPTSLPRLSRRAHGCTPRGRTYPRPRCGSRLLAHAR